MALLPSTQKADALPHVTKRHVFYYDRRIKIKYIREENEAESN